MNKIVEPVVFLGALLAGLAVCVIVGWQFMRAVRRGKTGRLVAVIAYGMVSPFLGMAPALIGITARWALNLVGISVLLKEGPDDGVMVGLGIMGMLMAMGAAVLFAVVMIFQAMTGAGGPENDARD